MPSYNATRSFLRVACMAIVIYLAGTATGWAQPITQADIMVNGPKANRINFVYVSEGYKSNELFDFYNRAKEINKYLFENTLCSPFTEYRSFFNAFALKVPSVESGITHPGNASDENTSNNQPVANRNTYFKASFDNAGIHRAVSVQNPFQVMTLTSHHIPEYDNIMVICNSPYYGGTGGQVSTFAGDQSEKTAQHELGHSYGDLADEYFAFGWEKANMTQNNNPATIKWKKWLGVNGTGIYPYGSSGVAATWFRPHESCVMQYLGNGFCPVCRAAIVDRIHQDISMVESYFPADNSFTMQNTAPPFFTVTYLKTTNNTIKVKWYLNNNTTPIGNNISFVSIPYEQLLPGENVLRADVIDSTDFSQTFFPAAGYVTSVTWNFFKATALATNLLEFSGKVVDGIGNIHWTTDSYDENAGFELEKSFDGVEFKKIATLKPEHENKYIFTDDKLFDPCTFYRLKVTIAGKQRSVSRIIRLEQPLSNTAYKVYQDAPSHKYQVFCRTDRSSQVALTVMDMNGAQLLQKKVPASNGGLTWPIDLSAYPAGTYLLRIQIDSKVYTARLVAL
jgi:hypothetical protein